MTRNCVLSRDENQTFVTIVYFFKLRPFENKPQNIDKHQFLPR